MHILNQKDISAVRRSGIFFQTKVNMTLVCINETRSGRLHRKRKKSAQLNTITGKTWGHKIFTTYSTCLVSSALDFVLHWFVFLVGKMPNIMSFYFQNFGPWFDLTSPCFVWQAALSKNDMHRQINHS